MKYNEYQSAMMSHMRNMIADINALDRVITFDYLENCVPPAALQKVERVILTGCGDSYCTAIAAKPAYDGDELYKDKLGTPTDTPRAVEFTRYYNTFRGWSKEEAESTLLGVISISGNPVRNLEALLRCQALGGVTVAFTNNPSGSFAAAAQHVVNLNVPPNEKPVPNVTSYLASVWACMMFGLYIGVVRGQLSREEAEGQRKAAMQYVNAFAGRVQDRIAQKAHDIALAWNGEVDLMDFVADGADYATAFFGSAKMVESFGGLTTIDDTEDWNHINFFNRHPEKTGTFIIANTSSPSFSRAVETVRTMCKLGRKVVVITDTDRPLFAEGATVFALPKAKYAWVNPLMQHMPMSYVAAYLGAQKGARYYRADNPDHNTEVGNMRLVNTEVVIL